MHPVLRKFFIKTPFFYNYVSGTEDMTARGNLPDNDIDRINHVGCHAETAHQPSHL